MTQTQSPILDSIRNQFNYGPYPHHPIDAISKDDLNLMYVHSMVTPYYLRHRKVPKMDSMTILDAGCGSGFKALCLAHANPGAKIVGIDISEKSIDLCHKRFAYHGLENAEFHVLGIEEVAQLGMQFDYINCDEVLYLLPELTVGLSALQSVLKPHGFIRSNLHSMLQRQPLFRGQEIFRMMGLMEGNPEDDEIRMTAEVLISMKKNVELRSRISPRHFDDIDEALDKGNISKIKEFILRNLLLQGDRGFTVPQLFEALRQSNLGFVSMVDWRKWDVLDLLVDVDELPVLLAMSLADALPEERLRLYELMNPTHRLLDFWCGHPNENTDNQPPHHLLDQVDWTENAMVHLHPVLQHELIRTALINSATTDSACNLSEHFDCTTPIGTTFSTESTVSGTLLPLLDQPQTIGQLADRYLSIRPVDPATLMPFSREIAVERIQITLKQLEKATYVLIEE
jgi:2-polyprenyl-3-methyl-5-hydroxy-6-metoxy-1,4-benzoquinol methylase